MKMKLIGLALVAATVAAVSLYPAVRGAGAHLDAPVAQGGGTRRIEVVFVLDTTSSMTGLIDTAKQKIWSIASTMAQAEQQPEISMGLVAYRDRGDDYVTRVVDLSPDLDSMYAKLMELAAYGGGDGPESVNAALADAVDRISWSRDPATYKVIFLVGDAPPHMDYQDERQYPETVRAAARRGIVVNAIQCGRLAHTAEYWSEIARLGGGRYLQVEQAGGGFAVATPYDDEIAQLSAELDGTRLHYGTDAERAELAAKAAETDALQEVVVTGVRARRGVYNATAAGSASLFGDRDLVADVASGAADLADVPETELPEPLRALDAGQREAEVRAVAERRAELQGRIRELAEARGEFIDDAAAETPGADESLDRQIYDVIRAQGAARGLSYERGPEY